MTDILNISPGATRAESAEQDAAIAEAVFGSGLLVACPLAQLDRAVEYCRNCPHCVGLGRVTVHGEAPLENRYRVMCNHAKTRALHPSGAPRRSAYEARLKSEIKRCADLPGRDEELEHRVFVEQSVAINCPVSRAKNGVWRVERPPCPACEYFRGLAQIPKRGIMVLCAHVFTLTMQRSVVGSTELVRSL